ncbi:MAG: TatD DNase family protein [Verrucomicrobiales bacterium]|jgi:TatD DNase family protein
MLVDSHCHLASPTLAADIDGVVERAIDAGVARMITLGTDLEDCQTCVDFADRFPQVHAAVGIHPCSVTETDAEDWFDQIEQMAQHPKIVAIGEIGLDYYHNPPEGWTEEEYHARQKDFLTQQLDLAVRLKKNVVIHNRDRGDQRVCWDDTLAAVLPYSDRLRAVFHCHIRDWASAAPLIEANHLVSFTGIATFKNAEVVRNAATEAVAGHFMVETDAPYLAPMPYRGKRCEPAYVRHTAQAIADFRRETLESLAAHTTQTAETFFGLG